ncbi:MAG: hypothetical protein KDJ16_02590 [Hyphomicrobiales bacterium]|nr:hypothetical protein [Hyphomicrobiales bacterium]
MNWRLTTPEIELDAENVAGIWWRRPKAHQVSPGITDAEVGRFCQREAKSGFLGWLNALGHQVMNRPADEAAAQMKPLQLARAAELGLKVPDTIVTNDPATAREFIESRVDSGCIFKILTHAPESIIETRKIERTHLDNIENLLHAPVIFQELVPRRTDIRATVVDDEVFCVAIDAEKPIASIDWRLDATAAISAATIPESLQEKLVELTRSLGLRYGAVDLRLTPDGDYCFFEINPTGQFLFCEVHGDQPISAAIAVALTNSA